MRNAGERKIKGAATISKTNPLLNRSARISSEPLYVEFRSLIRSIPATRNEFLELSIMPDLINLNLRKVSSTFQIIRFMVHAVFLFIQLSYLQLKCLCNSISKFSYQMERDNATLRVY